MYSWVATWNLPVSTWTWTGNSWTGSGVDGGDDELEEDEEKLSGDDRRGTDNADGRRSGEGEEVVLLAGAGGCTERGSSVPDFVC